MQKIRPPPYGGKRFSFFNKLPMEISVKSDLLRLVSTKNSKGKYEFVWAYGNKKPAKKSSLTFKCGGNSHTATVLDVQGLFVTVKTPE